MPLTYVTKGELISRAYLAYQEVAGGGEFSTAGMGTFANNAAREFSLKALCIMGSARRARPTATANAGEALLYLPTGMAEVKRVSYERTYGGGAKRLDITRRTPSYLNLCYGANWAYVSSTEAGADPEDLAWYRKGVRQLGFFPANLGSHTAGTVVIWGAIGHTAMSTSTQNCDIPPEYVPGVVYLMAAQMAERDADSDAEGSRRDYFQKRAEEYIALAGAYTEQAWEKED